MPSALNRPKPNTKSLRRLVRADLEPHLDARRRTERRAPALPVRADERHVGDLDLARAPAAFGRLEHVWRGSRRRRPMGCSSPACSRCGRRRRPRRRLRDRAASAFASSRFFGLLDVDAGRRRRRASARLRASVLPLSSHSARSQNFSTRSSECVTSRMVLLRRRNSANLSRHLTVNDWSPTASTSSMSSTSGST